jgi:hypothetical protein
MALGELIEDSTGKITGQRFLDVEIPKMETSFAMEGNYRGISCTHVGTYTSVLREGVLYGEGQGIITTKDGQGMATWTGQGIGKFTAPGKVSFPTNNMVGVFEYEVDEMGSCFTKSWEWK